MARPVDLVVGHQSGPLAGDPMADRLELVQLAPRREPDVVVLVPVRPENPASDRERDDRRRDHLSEAHGPGARREGGGQECRRRHRERLAAHPRRADRQVERAADARGRDVQQQGPALAPPRPPDADRGRGDHQRDQHLHLRGVVTEPEIAAGPDAEELELAQARRDQVAELGALAVVAHLAEEAHGRDEGRDREHAERRREDARPLEQRALGPQRDQEARRDERGQKPEAAGQAQHADERGAHGRQWNRRERAAPGAECPGHESRDRHEQPGARELLDPAPERVARRGWPAARR